ncbi:hypothetical protein COU58_03205 [Candidatus Pacearchaeota archaeon CG10_big_fil_rev_8_21_14_0_10_32_42]|nr:MAG: hypothetical protein COU58_03205 [Candidatus Pacearchaeota archaeon CG10_big_fil_rev_8_21_14_0_10_32_42]
MVYKKYITKNGKVYGPYFYQSKRINGKVVSEYHGVHVEDKNSKRTKLFLTIIFSVLMLAIIGFFLINDKTISGNLIFDVKGKLIEGELVDGKLNLILSEGEMIPASSKIVFENNGFSQEYNLNDFISDTKTESGNFYLKDSGVSGSGEGYGIIGKKITYPSVSFELKISSEETSEVNENPLEKLNNSINNSVISDEENLTERIEVNVTPEVLQESEGELENSSELVEVEIAPEIVPESEEKVPDEKEIASETIETEETPSENNGEAENIPEPESETPTITGNSIANTFGSVSGFITGLVTGEKKNQEFIQGEVSKEKEMVVKSGKVKLVSGSVKSNGETLPDETINLEKNGSSTIIRTEYSITEMGFGPKYFGENSKTFSMDLNGLNKTFTNGTLNIKLFYEGNEIASFSMEIEKESIYEEIKNITEIFNNTNVTIPESLNFTAELTQIEKNLILFNLNESSIKSDVKKYKDKYLVNLNLGKYNAEYSYPQSLEEDELKYYMEKDRYLWLKDILIKLSEKNIQTEIVENLSGQFPF